MSTENNTAPVMNEDLDTELLARRVKAMYQAVAADPHDDFHFEMGREMAERLGTLRPRSLLDIKLRCSSGGVGRKSSALLE